MRIKWDEVRMKFKDNVKRIWARINLLNIHRDV